MTGNHYQLLQNLQPTEAIAWWRGSFIDRDRFLSHVRHVAESMPEHAYAINLCEDRYCFLVSFVACLLRQQICLLPPSRALKEIVNIVHDYPDSYCLSDEITEGLNVKQHRIEITEQQKRTGSLPLIDNDCIAAILFTSGSTGTPKPNSKRWADLVSGAQRAQRRFALSEKAKHSIVATVPPQHMYGFETTIMYPLINGVCVYGDRPFFPEDVKAALERMPKPRILITTPVHLRACCLSTIQWPEIEFVISATAPLSTELARMAEDIMQTTVREIYGCTEAGSVASRRTIEGDTWQLYDGYGLAKKGKGYYLTLTGSDDIELGDNLEIRNDGYFNLLGRNCDYINIAGKRGSIGDLNCKLRSIEGVEDGVFVVPDVKNGERVRLAALVSAPQLSVDEVMRALAENIDRVFLPRPLIKVEQLPYNELGKLPRKKVIDIFNKLKNSNVKSITR